MLASGIVQLRVGDVGLGQVPGLDVRTDRLEQLMGEEISSSWREMPWPTNSRRSASDMLPSTACSLGSLGAGGEDPLSLFLEGPSSSSEEEDSLLLDLGGDPDPLP